VLRVERLSCAREGFPVLHAVDLEVKSGELVALVGPCGAGKSTLLRCLSRLAPADAEQLELEGADLRTSWSGWGSPTCPSDRRRSPT